LALIPTWCVGLYILIKAICQMIIMSDTVGSSMMILVGSSTNALSFLLGAVLFLVGFVSYASTRVPTSDSDFCPTCYSDSGQVPIHM
jgi:hypothetical protein